MTETRRYRVRLRADMELEVDGDDEVDAIQTALAEAMQSPDFEVESVESLELEEL
jgi:hypothetical protein